MKNLITFDITKETFHECVADRQMHLARGAVDPELMNWSDIDSALYYSDIAPPFMHLYKNGVVPPEKYIEELKSGSRTIQRLNTQAVQSLLEAGSTAILNRIDVRQELIRKLCEEVASFTDADTTANAYLAFSGEGSFGAHWDTHDVMAIQLIGKKHWRIYPPTYQFPLPGHTSKSFEAACPAEPIFDGMLEAGDLLYLPRGWWHEVLPVGETLHIAVGIYPPNILNYLAWFLEKNLRNHEELRRSLRPDAVTTDIISRACQVLTDQLNNPEVFSNFMDEISVKRIKPRIPFSLNSLSSLDKPLEPHPIP